MNRVLIGDNREQLATLPHGCVHCCVTSPPYWGLRSYLPADHPDKAKELGSEQTPEEFLATLIDVFRAVRRVLRDDGVLFVNLGDSYADDSKWGGTTGGKHVDGLHGESIGRNKTKSGYKPGDLCNMPHRLAMALQADGWFHRDTIIWHKPSPMPSSQNGVRWERCRIKVRSMSKDDPRYRSGSCETRSAQTASVEHGTQYEPCPGCPKCSPNDGYILRRGRFRTTTSHEYIFMFSKSKHYHADAEQCKEDAIYKDSDRQSKKRGEFNGKGAPMDGREPFRAVTETRLPRSIWKIPPEPYKSSHFATFPSLLAKRCIEMATSAAGCCATCGAQLAPVVSTERIPTRPGINNKIWKHADGDKVGQRSDSSPNLDPERHISRTIVSGYRPTCTCPANDPIPCVVLDPFGGSGRTAQAAQAMGRNWILCELNAAYVNQEMIDTLPKWAKEKRTKAPAAIDTDHRPLLDFMEAAK